MKIFASFDDGGIADIKIAEMMVKYSIETTFYIPVLWQKVNTSKGRFSISLQELQEIAAVHHIGSHTLSHPHLTSIPLDQALPEIFDSKTMLENIIKKPVTSFCYPRGYLSDPIKNLVSSAGYSDARTTKVGYLGEPDDPYETHTTLHVGYDRKEYKGKTWFDYGVEMFKKADDNSTFRMFGHGFELEDQLPNLEEFCRILTS